MSRFIVTEVRPPNTTTTLIGLLATRCGVEFVVILHIKIEFGVGETRPHVDT